MRNSFSRWSRLPVLLPRLHTLDAMPLPPLTMGAEEEEADVAWGGDCSSIIRTS